MAMQRLKEAAEKAKIELSGMYNKQILTYHLLQQIATGPKHMDININKSKI